MSPVTATIKFTYADYCLFPEDGRRHEIIDGERCETPAPNLRHQALVGRLHLILGKHLEKNRGGSLFVAPCDVVLSDLDVVQPDLVYIAADHADVLTEANVRGVPDLVIEVLSPSTRKVDLTTKRKLYESYGVREYWVVDPELETVRFFGMGPEGYGKGTDLEAETGENLTSAVVPQLSLPVSEIFRT